MNTITTPASVAARLTDSVILHLADEYDGLLQSPAIAAVLRDYVRLRKLANAVKGIINDKDAVDAKVKDGLIVTAVGAVEQIKRLLAEAEKGEVK